MKKIKITLIVIIALIFLLCINAFKIPVHNHIDSINLPENCDIYKKTKVEWSDVYVPHIIGEKVVKCDLGWEYVRDYVKNNNSSESLNNITICDYFGMSDDYIYSPELDNDNLSKDDYNKYALIKYVKNLK